MILDFIRNKYYYSFLSLWSQAIVNQIFLRPFYSLYFKTKIEYVGIKPSPDEHYIFVSNHRTMQDPPLIGFSMAKPVAFIAKKELFDNFLLRLFLFLTSTISVDREKPEVSTFRSAAEALKSKACGMSWCVGIFIEGTRSTVPGYLGLPNKGPIFIAKLSKCQIVPIGISYRANRELIIKVGEPYEIDYKRDLEDQAWECLEKISKLSDYKLPERIVKSA